jgi:hypothetical protein
MKASGRRRMSMFEDAARWARVSMRAIVAGVEDWVPGEAVPRRM